MTTNRAEVGLRGLARARARLREKLASPGWPGWPELAGRARTVERVARRTGILSTLTVPGLRVAASIFARGARNPSQVYEFHGQNSPKKPALRWRDRSVTFGELDDRIDRVAAGLQGRGFGPDSSVILMMKGRPELVEMQGGAGRIGAAAVSISWRSTAPELAYVANHSRARAIVFEADLWPVVQAAREHVSGIAGRDYIVVGGEAPGCDRYETEFLAARGALPRLVRGQQEAAAVVIYTSGTTGKPKGAVRKFPDDALFAFLRFIAETPMRVDDVHLVTCPLYHSTAMAFLAMTQTLGATAVLMDEFRPEAFLEHIARYRITTTTVVPTMLHRVMALGPEALAKHDSRSLRAIFCGGAPLSAPLATQVLNAFGDILFNFYGATETGLVTLAKPRDLRAAPGSIGRPVPGNEIRLITESGAEAGEGEVGELYVRNDMLVAGYHDDPESTRASMKEGFFSVGDLARRDSDERYFLEGRTRDMIISGGVNVYPAEIEAVLEAHPEVAEAAVVGEEDAEWGERARAFVVRRAGSIVDEAALAQWCRQRLAGPKVPRAFVFLESLPRNPTGKVLKRALRAAVH